MQASAEFAERAGRRGFQIEAAVADQHVEQLGAGRGRQRARLDAHAAAASGTNRQPEQSQRGGRAEASALVPGWNTEVCSFLSFFLVAPAAAAAVVVRCVFFGRDRRIWIGFGCSGRSARNYFRGL